MAYPLSIVTPEGAIYKGEVESVSANGVEGYFGVLTGHAPMIVALQSGPVTVKTAEETFYIAVGAGILEVSDKTVQLLADNAEKVDDLNAAKEKSSELEEKLKAFD